ncbi:hypothetical protein ACROYT_G031937 [Oculina patagonica]
MDRENVDSFLQHLNIQQPSIRFTMETESDSKLAFLDTAVSREPDGRLITSKITKTRKPSTNAEPATEFKSTAVLPTKQDGVVYRIPCECGKVYIGETGRPMQDRIKEHDRDIRLARTQTSAVAEHTNNTGHFPLWNELSGSPVEVYKAWVNCCLAQLDDQRTIHDLAEDLKDGVVLCQLIKLTTGHELPWQLVKDVPQAHQAVQLVIDYMKGKGIDVCCHVEDITSGKLKFILDVLWLIILHFEIHSANRAAYQRTVNLGKRFLLEWCCTEIPNTAIDPKGPFLDFLQDGVLLTKLITKYCPVDGINPSDLQVVDKVSFLKVLKAAEDRLGIPKKILSSSGILDDNTFDEYAVVIYMAVLRRMICAMKGEEPIKGGVKTEPSPSKPRNQPNGDSFQNYSPSKFPHNKTSLADSSFSPTSLRNLVDQHTKSHAAIQVQNNFFPFAVDFPDKALQERIQSVTQLASTPKLQKKLPEAVDMAPTLTEGISSTLAQEDVATQNKRQLSR